jgi:hypothetical protein
LSNIYRPESFQGHGKTKDYFEGWYFKIVDKEEKKAFAVIPGISLSKDTSKSHAFVMVFDARNHKMSYFKYAVNEFRADKKKMEVKIGKNFFSTKQLQLDMDDGINKVTADVKMWNIIPWPVSIFSPGVMGWYRFVPFMECYHANLSFDHATDGYIKLNGENTDLSGGKGYSEKDWGTSMPQAWIWMQTNHFDDPGISLFGSVAKVPWLGGYFTGYIFGFFYKGKLHKFTTYNGSRVVRLGVTDDHIEILAENKESFLEIKADRAEGVELPAPKMGEMVARVNESLASCIDIKFYRKTPAGKELLFSGIGRNAGLEFVGDLKVLLNGFK